MCTSSAHTASGACVCTAAAEDFSSLCPACGGELGVLCTRSVCAVHDCGISSDGHYLRRRNRASIVKNCRGRKTPRCLVPTRWVTTENASKSHIRGCARCGGTRSSKTQLCSGESITRSLILTSRRSLAQQARAQRRNCWLHGRRLPQWQPRHAPDVKQRQWQPDQELHQTRRRTPGARRRALRA